MPFAGHFAEKKMVQRIKQFYHWQGLRSDIHKKCSSCVTCASVRGQGNRGKPPLVSIPVGGPFDMIGMDFVELDVSKSGNKYALVFQDYLSKWPEVYALSNRRAETVAKCLQDLVWRHGVPNKIVHDRAAEFLADVLQETAGLLGVRQLPTSGGHPQTDGLVERFNRTLKQMLKKLVKKGGHDWDELLGPVLLAYRATPHASSGMSPFYLLYGRNPQLPSQLDFQVPVTRYPVMETEYGQQLAKELKQARIVAKQNIGKKQKEQKTYYDQKSKEIELQVGDLVMLKIEPRFKLDRSFKGPFVVKSLTSTNAVVQLKDDDTAELLNVSRQRLSRCEPAMATATPWVGHCAKLRRRRQIRDRRHKQSADNQPAQEQPSEERTPGSTTVTRRGRIIKKPTRFYMVNSPKAIHKKEGEVVRSRERQQENPESEKRAKREVGAKSPH